jgi:hypothetical protein
VRADNAYLYKEQQPAEQHYLELPEQKGKEDIDERKHAPPHNLKRPVSRSRKWHNTKVEVANVNNVRKYTNGTYTVQAEFYESRLGKTLNCKK